MGHHSLSFLHPLISFSFRLQTEITSSKVLFPEHLPLSKIQAGIKSGSFLQGTFRASRDNYLEATVFVQGEGEDSTEVCVCVCVHLSVNVQCCRIWTIIQNLETIRISQTSCGFGWEAHAYIKSSALSLWLSARFSSRVFRTSTEQCTRMWLPYSCCHGISGWRPPRSCCRMKAQQRTITPTKRRRRKRWIWILDFD